jgi:hypothetical protein
MVVQAGEISPVWENIDIHERNSGILSSVEGAMDLQLDIELEPAGRITTGVNAMSAARDDRWVFCVGCAVAVPAAAIHQHLRVCSGTTSA